MLKSIRNSLILTSVLYLALGLVLILFPGATLDLACILAGVVTLVYGAVRILSYFRDGGGYSKRFDLFIGVMLAILGVILLVSPHFIVPFLPFALGIYILVDSFTAMKKALDMKALGFQRWWISFLAAAVLAALGLVMIFRPIAVVTSSIAFIGAVFVFDGVYTLVNTIVADRVFRS